MMRAIRIWYVFSRTLGYVHSLIPLLVIPLRKLKVIEGNHVAMGMRWIRFFFSCLRVKLHSYVLFEDMMILRRTYLSQIKVEAMI